ncbi:ATP-binding protein [Actinacidiphila sp. ITFR-21]|uniref:ATP-binding protein n=1 Tax=Actinacidiphila sp. ITFR-21 TaxID=3075199 RepID=UPI00288B4E1A|nr:ATP-binding protein [Streptomyces sp. ITFR-21]WNI19947.1 ATP-binding protein [Streptomyces sp. ITFR-21]
MSTAIEDALLGRPAFRLPMRRDPASASAARRLVAAALSTWGLPQLAETSALVVSELVGNAVAHARHGRLILVTVTRVGPLRVRVAVVDRSHIRPAVRETGPVDEGGRGLLLIASVSATWGTDPLPWGKRVWAEIADAAEPPRSAPGQETPAAPPQIRTARASGLGTPGGTC